MNYDFSPGLRAVLEQANREARAVRHDYIGTEHVLLALLDQNAGPALDILTALGVDPEKLRLRVLELFRPGNVTTPMKSRPYTSRAKKVLEYAMAEARQLGAPSPGRRGALFLDTDHLLFGLIREGRGHAAKALESFNVTAATVSESASKLGRDRPSGSRSGVSGSRDKDRSRDRTRSGAPDDVWFVQIEPDSGTPIYEQLMAGVEEAVATNRLLPGERLPPVRDLAAELGVAPGTVARAYSALEQRGVLETEGARGTRVAERPSSSQETEALQPAIADLLRPVAVAAYHMGARARDVHAALETAMQDIFPGGQG